MIICTLFQIFTKNQINIVLSLADLWFIIYKLIFWKENIYEFKAGLVW